MELEIYIPPLSRLGKKPSMRINRNGTVSINASAANIIGLKPGDSISFLRDKGRGDWFISRRVAGTFTLRKYKNSGSLYFMSRSFTGEIFNSNSFPLEVSRSIEGLRALSIPIARNSVDGGHYALLLSGAH
jgi:hypothetical protein